MGMNRKYPPRGILHYRPSTMLHNSVSDLGIICRVSSVPFFYVCPLPVDGFVQCRQDVVQYLGRHPSGTRSTVEPRSYVTSSEDYKWGDLCFSLI